MLTLCRNGLDVELPTNSMLRLRSVNRRDWRRRSHH